MRGQKSNCRPRSIKASVARTPFVLRVEAWPIQARTTFGCVHYAPQRDRPNATPEWPILSSWKRAPSMPRPRSSGGNSRRRRRGSSRVCALRPSHLSEVKFGPNSTYSGYYSNCVPPPERRHWLELTRSQLASGTAAAGAAYAFSRRPLSSAFRPFIGSILKARSGSIWHVRSSLPGASLLACPAVAPTAAFQFVQADREQRERVEGGRSPSDYRQFQGPKARPEASPRDGPESVPTPQIPVHAPHRYRQRRPSE